MGRRSALLVVGSLVFALGACGGDDGGGEDAACGALDNLSELVADGELGDNNFEDAFDAVNDFRESTDGDGDAAAQQVLDAINDGDNDEADILEVIQDELGDLADDCDIDEFAEAPEEETTTTTEPEDETTTTSDPDAETTTTVGGDGAATEVNGRDPVPDNIAAEFAALAQQCFDGDPVACDDLFAQTPAGSVDEAYGDTCGGRIEDGQGFSLECATLMVAPTAVPAEVVDQANGQLCFEGDMVACDDMFRAAAEGTVDQAYGGLCGGRVQDTSAFCVDIFGDTAQFL